MRVLHISLDVYDGGASRCVRELLELLPAYGVEAAAWVARHPATVPPGIRVMRRSWENWLGFLEALPGSTDWRHRGSIAALSGIRRSDFDLVHLHVIHGGAASIRAVRDLCRRMPVVWTLHDEWPLTGGFICNLNHLMSRQQMVGMLGPIGQKLDYSPYHDNFRARDMARLLKKALPQPGVLIAPSYHMAELARRCGNFPNSEISVVRNGVRMLDVAESRLPRDEARRRLNLPASDRVVLMIAPHLRLAHKGVHFGIEALNRLANHEAGPPHVLMVGHGAEALGTQLQCPCTPLQASRDALLATAYRAADVTLVPSMAESFSLVAAESMACCTPVACFRVGGLVELIGQDERGAAVEPFDVRALSSRLAELLGSQDWRVRLGQAGREWVQEECSMRRHIENLMTLYHKAIAMRPAVEA